LREAARLSEGISGRDSPSEKDLAIRSLGLRGCESGVVWRRGNGLVALETWRMDGKIEK